MRTPASLSIIAVAAIMANVAGAGAASAAGPDLCAFLSQVVAAQAGGFAGLKGEPDTRVEAHYRRFHGLLSAEPGQDCTMSPQGEAQAVGAAAAPAYYECVIAAGAGFDAIEARYTAAASEIKACFPRWRYAERRAGDRASRTEGWELVGEGPRLRLRMQFFDTDVFRRGDAPDLKLTVRVTSVGLATKGGGRSH